MSCEPIIFFRLSNLSSFQRFWVTKVRRPHGRKVSIIYYQDIEGLCGDPFSGLTVKRWVQGPDLDSLSPPCIYWELL
jgi:hypothetical protein